MLVAKKPCIFGGKKFWIGDQIPDELVLNPEAQEKMGILTIVGKAENGILANDDIVAQVLFAIPIVNGNGTIKIDMSEENIVQAVSIMQMKAADAEKAIKDVVNESVLIFLNALDSRKSVKDAAKKKAMDEEESTGEE